MTIPPIESVETKEEGHSLAVEWQHWQSDQSLSYGEMAEWNTFFNAVAKKFPELTEEFQENGIIEYVPPSNSEYLRDLAERLRHVPGTYNVDGWDIDQLHSIAAELEGKNPVDEPLRGAFIVKKP